MTWPMIALGFSISIVQRGRAGYARLKEIFDAVPEVTDGPLPEPATVKGGRRRARPHLRVRRAQGGRRRHLRGAAAGKSIAIVGRTGSGKSTLAMLLARLLPTPPGAVLIDGQDVCDLPLSAVRKAIGYAQQDAFLFSTTVARNIGFSLDDSDSDEAHRAHPRGRARGPGARRGARPARAVRHRRRRARRAALGRAEAAHRARARARARAEGARARRSRSPPSTPRPSRRSSTPSSGRPRARTVVLITHRVAAASRCDRIVVLDEGRVIERGHARRAGRRRRPLRRVRRGAVRASPSSRPWIGPGRRRPARRWWHERARAPATPHDRGKPAAGKSRGTLRDFHEEERSAAPTTRSCCAGCGRSCGRTARYLFASLALILAGGGPRPGAPARDGRLVESAQKRAARAACCATASCSRRLVVGMQVADLRADVHDADRRRARDGRPAPRALRVHAAARAPLLRPHAGRPPGHARHQRRRRASASSSPPACSTPSAIWSPWSASSS